MNQPFINTKRLSRNILTGENNNSTYQSKLTKKNIDKYLEGYIRIESNKITQLPLNTHIRYFVVNPKNNNKQFRLGGFITKIGDNNEYIIVSNGNFSWSVQLTNTIFYRKLKLDEYKEQICSEVDDSIKKKLDSLAKENKELKDVIKELKDVIKEIKNTTLQNKKKK